MGINRMISLVCAMVMTLSIAYEAVEIEASEYATSSVYSENLVQNGGFENVDSRGLPVGFSCTGGWGGAYVRLVTDRVHSGSHAARIETVSGGAPFVSCSVFDMVPGAKYQLSLWYDAQIRGDSGFSVKIETYSDNTVSLSTAVQDMHTPSYRTSNGWTQLVYTFVLPEKASMASIYPRLYSSDGTVYVDDMELYMIEGPEKFTMSTDKVFYYSHLKSGYATVRLNDFYEDTGYTVDFKIVDGDTTISVVNGVTFGDKVARYEFPLSLLTVKKREYTAAAAVKDANGEVIAGFSQKIYKYDRPQALTKDGVYIKNGQVINPVILYHPAAEDYAEYASAGINVIQFTGKSTIPETLAALDAMEEIGLMAAVVCYWDMRPAGHDSNLVRVSNFVKAIKDHPAVFCYMVMDEPFSHDPNAQEDLRKSYKMLRDIDDVHPVYACEAVPDRYAETGKYVDCLAIDPYPGIGFDYGKYVGDMTVKAREAVDYDKPVYNILQAFTFGQSKPQAHELHQMIYQAFMGGSQGIGYYTWVPDDPTLDDYLNRGIYWPVITSFKELEYETVFKHFGSYEYRTFSKYSDNSVWYESWTDGEDIYVAVINRLNSNKSVTVPLVSANRKIEIGSYDIEVVNGGELSAVQKNDKSFTASLTPRQAVLYKIKPSSQPDYNLLSDLALNGSFEVLTNGEVSPWSFTGTNQASSLVTTGGSHGDNYVQLTAAGLRVEQTISGIDAGSAYLLELDYKAAAGSAASIVVESARNWTKLVETTLPQAGSWTTWRQVVRVRKFDNAGLVIRLRNMANVSVTYDNVKLVKLEDYDVKNLIPDPSFEFCEAGTITPFTNWGTHYRTATIMSSDGGVMPTSGSKFLKLDAGAATAVTTDALVDNSAELDYNAENYSFVLSFDVFVYGGGSRPNVTVRGYKTDGSYAEYNYNATNGGLVCGNWTWERKYIRLDEVTTSTTNKFRIYITSGNLPMAIDNVSLIAHKASIDILDEDGKILNSLAGVSGDITARGQYVGNDDDAVLYIALYTRTEFANRLEQIKMCSLSGDGSTAVCTLNDIDDGNYILKAFIWSSGMEPVIKKELSTTLE